MSSSPETAARRVDPPVSRGKTLLCSGLAVLLALGLPELALRLLDAPPAAVAGSMDASAARLWALSPGTRIEHGHAAHVNALGLRGPEIAVPKPAGVRRFMTLGDSSIYGFGVADEEVFSAVAARALGPGVEGIDGGVPGYSTYQSMLLLEAVATRVAPDLVIVGNLWSDNNFDGFTDRELLAGYAEAGGSTSGRVRQALSHSALFRFADGQIRGRRQADGSRRVGWMRSGEARIGRRRVEINEYARNLDRLARRARELGAEVVFLVPANEEDLGPPVDHRAWTPYREVMRRTAARVGAPLIEVPEVFRASGRPREALFVDQMHPTAEGHRRMGEAVATLLRATGWTGGASLMAEAREESIPEYQDEYALSGRAIAPGTSGIERMMESYGAVPTGTRRE